MKEVKEYLNRETWSGHPYGLKAEELFNLTAICEDMAEGLDSKEALHNAVMNAAMAAFACGFDRGRRKIRNDQRRKNRRQKSAAES